MLASKSLERAVRCALLTGAAAAVAVPAYAAEEPENIQEIVVTGTRIVRPDYEGASPIVSVAAEQIRNTGATAVDQVLNTLPQFVPSITNTSNNPGNGQANIDLRGLGTFRNLVLLDGRRLPPSGSDGTVDVNIIPTALLQRVEVLTGGGSSVYGSDAIAGVTNFVLNDKFTGVQVDGGYNQTDRSDGDERTANLTVGTAFQEGRGHVIASVGYMKRDGILQGDREFSELTLRVRRSGNTPQGSGTIPFGKVNPSASNRWTQAALDTAFGAYGFPAGSATLGEGIAFNNDGTLFTTGLGSPGTVLNFKGPQGPDFSDSTFTYNFAPPNQLLLPAERTNALGRVSYDFDTATFYAQMLYADSDVDTQLAAVPGGGISIPVTNPFIPAGLAT
ncbi:MAG TPA: TonB-dependent receptor plug domain-containing protein, partial [Povalibacter sp.]|nr:TonB-dependent receptor plug domain-containing protein [Povalibacter sp.]